MTKAKGDATTAHTSKQSAKQEVVPNDQESLNTGIVRALPERLLTDQAYLLGRLGREARRQFTQVLSAWELHPSHYGILLLLEAIGQASQQQLAQTLTIDRANMVDLLDALQQRGFIERQADPLDRRRHVVRLTPVGQRELQQIRQAREVVDDAFFAGLDTEEQEMLHRLLVKLFISLTEQPSARELSSRLKEGHP
jgi:MarR family transcriptional regulator, lower aerobic nicotinate degradation pathway regulator